MPGRPVAERANLIAASTASVPELAKNAFSRQGMQRSSRSARTPASGDTSICTRLGNPPSSTLLQRVAHARMVASEREHAASAQQVEIFRAARSHRYWPRPRPEAHIEADGLEHAHHLLVQVARVQRIAFGFALGEQRFDVNAHFNLPPPGRGTVAPVKSF